MSITLGQHCIRNCLVNVVKTSQITLHQKTPCAMLVQGAQACFRRKTGCSFKCLEACFLTWYNMTQQSWLFLFNVGSGVHLRLAGEQ